MKALLVHFFLLLYTSQWKYICVLLQLWRLCCTASRWTRQKEVANVGILATTRLLHSKAPSQYGCFTVRLCFAARILYGKNLCMQLTSRYCDVRMIREVPAFSGFGSKRSNLRSIFVFATSPCLKCVHKASSTYSQMRVVFRGHSFRLAHGWQQTTVSANRQAYADYNHNW